MKKIKYLLLILLLAFGLVSCGGEETPEVKDGYTITFDMNGYGEQVNSIENVKSIPAGMTAPVEPGYEFGGWFYDEACTVEVYAFSAISSDVTLYAKWTALNYNVNFNNNGHGSTVDAIYSNKLPLNLPVLSEEGYIFNGWYSDARLTKKVEGGDVINSNMTLYASWTLITFEISFVNNGHGEALEAINLPSLPEELPVLEEEGYQFAGWYMDEEFNEIAIPQTALDKDVTLYAKWYDFSTNSKIKSNYLSANGYLNNNITNFSQYENTSAYVKVTTADEFITALKSAKSSVTNTWDSETASVVQTVNSTGTVHVIEIMNDLNLGYNVLSSTAKSSGIVDNYVKTYTPTSQMVLENGISQIKIESTSNLLVFSKNGSKLTHAGFKLTSCHNVVFRNLSMDEIWEWEDSSSKSVSAIGDYDRFGWAYFKISHCGQVWIDHMDFGKSYDGQIDYANPVSNTEQTKFRLAKDSDGTNGLHISNCNFNGGSDDKDGYLYKMMEAIEADYIAGNSNYLYYKALRDAGATFEQILYGLAIPQKKGFLLGDGVDVSKPDFEYNYQLRVSFVNCKFINLEDRAPKVRGGDVVMYNCLLDASIYYDYRTQLQNLGAGAKAIVQGVNSSWKCALVSQAIVIGCGAYAHLENCVIKGYNTLVNHNDSYQNNTLGVIKSYYSLINCSYQKGSSDEVAVGSTTDSDAHRNLMVSSGNIKNDLVFPKQNGAYPFGIAPVELDDIYSYLNDATYGSGTKSNLDWLNSYWTIS